jgi:membrane protease YdiL (CAAX protease family)
MERQPHPHQAIVELVLVIAGLGLLVWRSPLGTEGFEVRTGFICAVVFFYAAYRLVTHRGTAERWGLPFAKQPNPADSLRGLEEDTFGCVLIGGFFLAGAAPMMMVRLVAPPPVFVSQPAAYLVWCAVQDFLFFALILRNLEDYIDPSLAVGVTATLFGLSHYPFSLLMGVTAVAGAVWGYAFLQTRSLMLVTLSHWLMGVILLS